MPPFLALILWLICLVALFRLDPAKELRSSPALWVPIVSMFITATRNPSQWLGGQVGGMSAQAFEEGNPVDRTISLLLILIAIGILIGRSLRWSEFFTRNLSLVVFILFALVSILWSDFPFVAFKRWFRDIGSYLIVLVVLSDPRPVEAVSTVLRRLCYMFIPLSVLLDKYFPGLSKQYDEWSGVGYFAGATTSKNMLGLICLISGLFFFWDTVRRWQERKQKRTKRILYINAAFMVMTADLLMTAHSTTSSVCLVLGVLVVLAAYSKTFRRRPGLLRTMIPAAFLLYLILDFGFNMNGSMAQAVGKDPTLSDRTKIWAFLLSMHTNPVIGTGYQSFWLGPRLEWFWANAHLGHINEAHNGYLGIYLDLGLIGVSLLVAFLVASYRKICKKMSQGSDLAVLALALWMVLVFYNMSEASFNGGVLYWVFLLGAISLPVAARSRVKSFASINSAEFSTQASGPSGEMTGQWR